MESCRIHFGEDLSNLHSWPSFPSMEIRRACSYYWVWVLYFYNTREGTQQVPFASRLAVPFIFHQVALGVINRFAAQGTKTRPQSWGEDGNFFIALWWLMRKLATSITRVSSATDALQLPTYNNMFRFCLLCTYQIIFLKRKHRLERTILLVSSDNAHDENWKVIFMFSFA